MPNSVWDSEVQITLDQANKPGARLVYVGNRNVEVLTPFPSPIDWRDIWIYFLMVDRFNNPAAPPHHQPWDQPWGDYQGGTFAGIKQQLDYLQELGVGALWLSPLLKNCQFSPSYHGYGFQNFLAIEPRFSSDPGRAHHDLQFVEGELRELVDAAHARSIYVIFDIVLHHVGDVFAYPDSGSIAPWNTHPYPILWRDEQGNPNAAWSEASSISNPPLDAAVWPRELQGNRFFTRQGNAFVDAQIMTAGDFDSLKALVTDYQTPEGMTVFQTLVRAFNYLIAKYDVDGFRIDTLMYLDPAFARHFANSIREFAQSIGKKNFFTFGEVWGSEEQIAHFIGRNAMSEGEPIGVDAALDYPLFYKLPAVVKGQLAPAEILNMYEYRRQVETGILSTHGDASNFFVTFLDNHDQSWRFFYRDPHQPDAYDDQVSLGVGCLFSLPGIPCLYYGTEQGLAGAGSSSEWVREALWGNPDAFSQESIYFQAIQRLSLVRDTQPALRYGRPYSRPISGDGVHFGISTLAPGILSFSRILSDQEVLIVANTSTQNSWDGAVLVDEMLNPVGKQFRILYSNQDQFETPGPVVERPAGSVEVAEIDGGVSHGPLHAISVNLRPMEIQILGK
jgi:glycosidase